MVGLFTAAASIMITSYLGSSNYGMKDGFEFTVISAVVLGGTALVGGKGSIFTTAVAAIFLATIKSGMDAFQIQSYMQRIIEGVILIFAFSINGIRAYVNDFLVKSRSRRELDERRRGSAAAPEAAQFTKKEGCVPGMTCSSAEINRENKMKRLGDGLFMLKKTRILALVLCFAMAISLAACSSDSGTAPAPSTAAPAAPAAPPTKRPPRPRLKPPASNSAGRSTTTSRNSSRA